MSILSDTGKIRISGWMKRKLDCFSVFALYGYNFAFISEKGITFSLGIFYIFVLKARFVMHDSTSVA